MKFYLDPFRKHMLNATVPPFPELEVVVGGRGGATSFAFLFPSVPREETEKKGGGGGRERGFLAGPFLAKRGKRRWRQLKHPY